MYNATIHIYGGLSRELPKKGLFFLLKEFAEKLFGLLKPLFSHDHRLGFSPRVADESLLMEPVHRFLIEPLPGPPSAFVLPGCDEIKKGKGVFVDFIFVIFHFSSSPRFSQDRL
jgi:hypothetical protein